MDEVVLAESNVSDAIADSIHNLVIMVFSKTQSPYYKQALGIAAGALRYSEYPVEKTVIHTVVFSKSRDQAARAIALLRYIEGWSTLQLFVAGRLHTGPVYALRNVLECYQESAHCKDSRAYCVHLSDVPFKREYAEMPSMSFHIVTTAADALAQQASVPKQIRFFIPCRVIPEQRFIEKSHTASWGDQVQALAVRLGVDWCPHFNMAEFRQLE